MVVDELVAILSYDVKGEDKLRSFNSSLDAVAKRMTLLAVAAGTIVAGAMASFGKSVIETSAKFESYAATLETIEGSAEKAKSSLDWVANFGKTTPYEVGEVTEAFVRLKAYGLDPMDGTLSAVGDAASAMGKGLMQGVEAIADAATGEFERLKEFGIKSKQAGDKVTFTWSQNGKELTKTVKKSSTEIVNFLKENFGARFSGAMIRQSKTWNGMISNLGDTWVDFQRRVGDSGFFQAVKNQLGRAMDYFGQLDANGTIDRWANNIGAGLTRGVDFIASAIDRMGRHFTTIGRIIDENKGAWEWLKWALGAIALRAFPVTAIIAGLGIAVDDLLTYLGGGKSVIGDFVQAIADFAGVDVDKVEEIVGVLGTMAGLTVAAGGIAAFTLSLNPLTQALIAFGAAYVAAKAGFEYLAKLKAEVDLKADTNLAADNASTKDYKKPGPMKPGTTYIGADGNPLQSQYDSNGKTIYMDGARRVDAPIVNPQAGFTQDALDYKTMMENLEGNAAKMGGGAPANAVLNDNKQDNRNQSVTVDVGGVVVNGVANATAAVGAAVGNAVGNAASRLPPTRTVQSGAF